MKIGTIKIKTSSKASKETRAKLNAEKKARSEAVGQAKKKRILQNGGAVHIAWGKYLEALDRYNAAWAEDYCLGAWERESVTVIYPKYPKWEDFRQRAIADLMEDSQM